MHAARTLTNQPALRRTLVPGINQPNGRGGQPITIMQQEPRSLSYWMAQLPSGYRFLALHNVKANPLRHSQTMPNMACAVLAAFGWNNTPEGPEFWKLVYNHYSEGTPLPPLPDASNGVTPEPGASPQPHTNMDYSTTPVARVILVYGEDVNSMDERRCMQIMRVLNDEIADLKKVNEIAESATVLQRIAEKGAALAEVVKRLDTFATPVATPAA